MVILDGLQSALRLSQDYINASLGLGNFFVSLSQTGV